MLCDHVLGHVHGVLVLNRALRDEMAAVVTARLEAFGKDVRDALFGVRGRRAQQALCLNGRPSESM